MDCFVYITSFCILTTSKLRIFAYKCCMHISIQGICNTYCFLSNRSILRFSDLPVNNYVSGKLPKSLGPQVKVNQRGCYVLYTCGVKSYTFLLRFVFDT